MTNSRSEHAGETTARDTARLPAPEGHLLHKPDRMKLTVVLVGSILQVGSAMSFPRILPAQTSKPEPEPVAASSCIDRYSSLLKGAKTALIAGDCAATADLLEQAKRMVPTCPLWTMQGRRGPLSP
jgi:hypothetical protein